MHRARSRAARRAAQAGACAVAILFAAGCGPGTPQAVFAPASDFAGVVGDLFSQIIWWALGVFVVVEGLLVYVLVRFRHREGNEEAAQFRGNTLLEIGWTLAPAVILTLIAVPTVRTIFQVDRPPPGAEDMLTVQVTAHQWWWEFEYPELGVTTANELHVPADRKVQLEMSSADVIHSFWVPRIGGKRDVLPGKTTRLWFTVDTAGVYPGQCAEFCGTSHALMRMLLVAQDSADFRRWVREMREPARPPTDSLARAGRRTFMRVCIACHTVRGTPARGTIGPDLTHVDDRRTIAAGVMENTPENMARWLRHPQEIKPANEMRIPDLSEAQIRALVAYLNTLD